MNVLRINNKFQTILFTILHFTVDGICAFTIFSSLYGKSDELDIYVFLTYNICAFVLQPFIGLLNDKIKNHKLFLIISFALLTMGMIFTFNGYASAIFLGLGNAFFHIAGGKYVSDKTNNDILSIGIFVSSGAFGLVLGQLFHGLWMFIIFMGLLIMPSVILLLSKSEENVNSGNTKAINKRTFFILIILIMIVVLIRSFVGVASPISFDKTTFLILMIGLCSMLGKALGGLFSKFIGIRLTIIISCLISIVFLLIGDKNQYLYLIGIFFFNFSMPITLYFMNILLQKRKGLAFGLLASVLYPGYLLGFIGFDHLLIKIIILILSLLTLVIVLAVDYFIKKEINHGNCI